MAYQNGYFPEYFEQVALPLYEDRDDIPVPGTWEELYLEQDVGVAPLPTAPWVAPLPLLLPGDYVTTQVEIASSAADLLDPAAIELIPDPQLVEMVLAPPTPRSQLRLPADAIAVYRPWHLHGEQWGIYISEPAMVTFTGALATLTGASPGELAPLALRQILEHEWTHFAFEVAGTEIQDATGFLLYPQYVLHRAGTPTAYTGGILEEVVASWAEIALAVNPPSGFKRLRPRGYKRAVEHLLQLAGPGYSEGHLMDDWDLAVEIVAAVASLIGMQEMRSWRWGRLDEMEKQQVPVYWLGDATTASAFGAFSKQFGPPSIRRLEAWLTLIGATPHKKARGKGSHRRWRLPNGRVIGYGTSKPDISPRESRDLADALGLELPELRAYVATGTVPREPASLS